MMRVNVDKVLEKDQKLAELDGRAGRDFLFFICFNKPFLKLI